MPQALILPDSADGNPQSGFDLTAFIARTAADAVLREAILYSPELLSDPRFSGELTFLLERYLFRDEEQNIS